MAADLFDDAHLVGDDDRRDAEIPVDVLDEGQDGVRGGRVKGGGGFVAEQHLRVGGQGTGDGHALLLAAGELRRIGIHAVGKAHQIQQFFSTLAGLDLVHADKFQRKADVLARRALHEQVELLEDHAHGTPGSAQLALRQTAHVLAFKKDGTARGTFQHVDAADERALAGTALADDTEDVPFVDGKIDALQGKNIRIFAAVTFFQIDDIDDRRFGHSASPLIPLSGVFEVSISSPARKEKRCRKMCCARLRAIVGEGRGAEKKPYPVRTGTVTTWEEGAGRAGRKQGKGHSFPCFLQSASAGGCRLPADAWLRPGCRWNWRRKGAGTLRSGCRSRYRG